MRRVLGVALSRIERNPLARDVAARLIGLIVNGVWSPGDRIPSERQLADLLGVSRTTVREAISLLAAMNLVEKQAARGTFIKELGIDPVGYEERFRDLLKQEGFDMAS